MEYILQETSTRDAVWIHSSDGGTVGRFGRNGIDIHNSPTVVRETGIECLLCTHRPSTPADWKLFREMALDLWGIDVPEDAFEFQTPEMV